MQVSGREVAAISWAKRQFIFVEKQPRCAEKHPPFVPFPVWPIGVVTSLVPSLEIALEMVQQQAYTATAVRAQPNEAALP
jgi:hypothetical protein